MRRKLRALEFTLIVAEQTRVERTVMKSIMRPLKPTAQPPKLIVTNNIADQITHWQSITGQRLFVTQIVQGVYQQITDDPNWPAALSALLMALITVGMSLLAISAARVINAQLYNAILLSALSLVVLVWLKIGAQSIWRLRRRSYAV